MFEDFPWNIIKCEDGNRLSVVLGSLSIMRVLLLLLSITPPSLCFPAQFTPRLPSFPGNIASLSLVQLRQNCALIGRELYSDSFATPALLCDKEPAQGIQNPLLGGFLAFRCLFMALRTPYDSFFLFTESSQQKVWNALRSLEQCVYST